MGGFSFLGVVVVGGGGEADGPAVNVHLPKDRVSGNHQCFGFVEFMSEDDAECAPRRSPPLPLPPCSPRWCRYAIKVLNMIKLYGKPIRVNKVRRAGRWWCAGRSPCDWG